MPRYQITYEETSVRREIIESPDALSVRDFRDAWADRADWLFDQLTGGDELDSGYCDSSEVIVKALK